MTRVRLRARIDRDKTCYRHPAAHYSAVWTTGQSIQSRRSLHVLCEVVEVEGLKRRTGMGYLGYLE